MTTVTLDQDQRAALRRALGGTAEGLTGGALAFDRESIHLAAQQLQLIAMTMDAIGWNEATDDEQPLALSSPLVSWACKRASDFREDLRTHPEWRDDEALDELGVLQSIGGGA